jgi:hypothetical protein
MGYFILLYMGYILYFLIWLFFCFGLFFLGGGFYVLESLKIIITFAVKKYMQQILLEKKNVLPKNMFEIYNSIGCLNYKFNNKNAHINFYENICLIAKSLNRPDWTPEVNNELKIYFPLFIWDDKLKKIKFVDAYLNKNSIWSDFSLGFKTKELAKYAGRTFIDQYNKFLTTKYNSKLTEKVDYRDIETMSDVYKINGITQLSTPPNTKKRHYEDLILIARALNGSWENRIVKNDLLRDYRWFPYFSNITEQTITCINTDYYFGDILYLNSQIFYKNSEIAQYAGNQFLEQYKKIFKFY